MNAAESLAQEFESDNRISEPRSNITNINHMTSSVYLAYPLHIHQSLRAGWLVHLARERFPNAAILVGCDLFTSHHDWRRRWPAILPTLSAVCVATDADGWIGRGVFTEAR